MCPASQLHKQNTGVKIPPTPGARCRQDIAANSYRLVFDQVQFDGNRAASCNKGNKAAKDKVGTAIRTS